MEIFREAAFPKNRSKFQARPLFFAPMLRLFFLFLSLVAHAVFKKIEYPFTPEPIDVVIPCAPKDLATLEHCIEGIRRCGKNLRRIIVVSKEPMTGSAEWFSEDLFPFSKREIALEIFRGDAQAAELFASSPQTRMGWIFQQFLKFYAPFVIPNLSSNVLILDSDVIFLKKHRFMSEDGEPVFIPGREYHPPYFEHAARLLPDLKRVDRKQSGIAHHMLFQKMVLQDLFQLIEQRHGTEPWRAMCRCIDRLEAHRACMSEYEIYFNFVRLRCNQAIVRPAKWCEIASLALLPLYRLSEEVFVACPEYMRREFDEKRP